MTNKYERVSHQGKRLDAYTLFGLREAERRFGGPFTITQGGYNGGAVSASAGTHNGGGVVDISTRAMSSGEKREAVRALREAGFAAWLRTPDQGDWPEHIHAVQLGNAKRSPSAKRQAEAYRRGLNGLANGRRDDGPRVKIRVLPYTPPQPARPRVAKALAAVNNALEHAKAKSTKRRLTEARTALRKAKAGK